MEVEWISQGPSPEDLNGVYVFTQPANNSVQGPRPHSIHHTHDQVEGDEMSLSIATHFGGLNESHSPRSYQTQWSVLGRQCPNSSRKREA